LNITPPDHHQHLFSDPHYPLILVSLAFCRARTAVAAATTSFNFPFEKI
jgi:hypothetical protein